MLSTALTHLDKAVGLIKDDDSVTRMHVYPHLVMAAMDCQECEGSGYELDSDTKCGTCRGSGKITKPSFDSAMVVEDSGINEGNKNRLDPVMQWLYPGVDIMKHIDEKAQAQFIRAFRSVGLKSILDVAESGESKKHRLEDLGDRLEECANLNVNFAVSMLLQIEYYKVKGTGRTDLDIQVPTVSMPKSFHALSRQELSTLIDSSSGYIRTNYIKYSYIQDKGNTALSNRISEIVCLYAPLNNYSLEEQQFRINNNAYSSSDIIRADYAYKVFEELSNQEDFLTKDIQDLFVDADLLLTAWGVLQDSVVTEPNA